MMEKDYENWNPPAGQLEIVKCEDGYVRVTRCVNGIPVENHQPERSKREESPKLVYREPNPETMSPAMKAKYEKAKAICGALNTVETQ